MLILKQKFIILVLLFGFIILFVNEAFVFAAANVEITGGNVGLTISTASAGEEPDPSTDDITGLLYYATAAVSYKITVKTDLVSPQFTLKVLAKNIQTGGSGSGGSAQTQVTINTTDQELIRDILKGKLSAPHSCDLEYNASASVSQGTGSDVHTITYTIIEQ